MTAPITRPSNEAIRAHHPKPFARPCRVLVPGSQVGSGSRLIGDDASSEGTKTSAGNTAEPPGGDRTGEMPVGRPEDPGERAATAPTYGLFQWLSTSFMVFRDGVRPRNEELPCWSGGSHLRD